MICYCVTDSGCGVKEGEHEKLFERFFRAGSYTEGVGLGLSLARRLARTLGGDVILDTQYRDGARFILKLPKE
jgi:signal transduction histidine kinase